MAPEKSRSARPPEGLGTEVGVDGDGEGLGDGVGVGDGSGLGDGDGATVGDAGQGDALGDADSDALGEAVGDGLAEASASGSTVGAGVVLGECIALAPTGAGEAVSPLPGDADGAAGAVVQSDVGDGFSEEAA
jgi:hypothetical protein